jgi:DMSO/TMAO reductase YedYZ molybdopterin-dependent catalytic subunit
MPPVSRGFHGRRATEGDASRIPPGQYLTDGFPVLSAGPTPRTPPDRWSLTIDGAVDEPRRWSWSEFLALPAETFTADIQCVTKWSKLDTRWTGVPVDVLLDGADSSAEFVTAWCDEPEHGGPARLLVPHLYFWKSAKWLRGLTLTVDDEPGFWETYGYHNYGDPWQEQRYWGD